MHEQEVRGIVLLADGLRHAGGHRHGGNACGTNQRIDGTTAELVHDLSGDQTTTGGHAERGETAEDDQNGLQAQEVGRRGGSADRDAQEDGDDVHQLVLGSLGQTVGNAANVEEITEHQATDECQSVGNNEYITIIIV